ncbi:MAG: RNase adapter RapZ [Pseudomonadota bacterium]
MTTNPDPGVRVVLVTGLAGAGKTTVSDALEDAGAFCVDNLPVALVAPLVEFSEAAGGRLDRLGLVAVVQQPEDVAALLQARQGLQRDGHQVELLFLDARPEVLVRRFSESRRRHPLDQDGRLDQAIQHEGELLEPLRHAADHIIDTSELKARALRQEIGARYSSTATEMQITLSSFGFKHGLPRDAQLILDARFLPNPFFVEALRERTGQDAAVAGHVLQHTDAQTFLDHIEGLVLELESQRRTAGRTRLHVAIGCTGGHHRSVALIEALARRLLDRGLRVSAPLHRDINR